jgi:hypothetical protein
MIVTRTIDPEHNWFWEQGYDDGFNGLRAIAPDETRYSFQRIDYFAGYDAGQEDREDMLRSLGAVP